MIHFLLLQPALQADTVVTVAARDVYDVIHALAAGSIAAVFLAILATILFVLLQVRKATKAIEETRRKISADPIVENVRNSAAHLEAISGVARAEATRLSTSVSHLSDRLTQASERMEERIEEFNALMEVVQGEAEETFVDSAATARGVRAGLESLGGGDGRTSGTARTRNPDREIAGQTHPVPPGERERELAYDTDPGSLDTPHPEEP